jgi:hypothetical protein
MPSVNWIECQIESVLSNPWYTSMFYNLNEFRTKTFDRRAHRPEDQPHTPASVARQTAKAIVDNRMLIDPVEVGELAGPIELYRAHDGSSTSRTSAGTLGRCWFSRELMDDLWSSTEGMGPGRNRVSHFKQLMRACNLVLFEWNAMTQIACMKVPDGCRVAIVAGTGNWQAMMPKSKVDRDRPLKKNFTRQLSRMATDPTIQYVVPILNPNWVQPVGENEPAWPLRS